MKTWFTVMIALGVFSGCGKTNDAPSENENEVTERRSPSKAVRGRNARPVAAYWDGGVHMLGKPPSVLFAAWADGMVVRKVDQKTMAGFVSPEAISKLIATLRTAGVFASSTSASLEAHGMLFPDGPVRCLSIVDGARRRMLYYHERYDLNRFEIRCIRQPVRHEGNASDSWLIGGVCWRKLLRYRPTSLNRFRVTDP